MRSAADSSNRKLGGSGTLLGPTSGTQFDAVIGLIERTLPLFAESVLGDRIDNENGLNHRLSLFLTNTAIRDMLPFFANRESMEDETHGNSPAPDIGIYLYADDTAHPPPKITVFEGKRLTVKLGSKRQKEYVIGHEDAGQHILCGGIERFKLSIHAREFERAGMIGYVQDGTHAGWLERVNTWILELSEQKHNPKWLKQEQLLVLAHKGIVTECTSTVYRKDTTLCLTHLWIHIGRNEATSGTH